MGQKEALGSLEVLPEGGKETDMVETSYISINACSVNAIWTGGLSHWALGQRAGLVDLVRGPGTGDLDQGLERPGMNGQVPSAMYMILGPLHKTT